MAVKHLRQTVLRERVLERTRKNRVVIAVVTIEDRGVAAELPQLSTFELQVDILELNALEFLSHIYCLTGSPLIGEDAGCTCPSFRSGTRLLCAVSSSPPSIGGRFSRRLISFLVIAPFWLIVE